MHELLTYIVLIICLLMFFVKREHKVCLLIIYILCFNKVSLPVMGNTLSPYFCFFLSELVHYKEYIPILKRTILRYALLILLFGIFILAIKSPQVEGCYGIIKLFRDQFIMRYGIIFMVFVACLSIRSQKPIITVTFVCLLILTGFGVINLLNRHAIYVDWVFAGIDVNSVMAEAGAKFTYSDRFRVQSMFANPFDYGYACLMLLLYYLYLYKGRFIGGSKFYVAAACCLFGIFSCGARTLLACLIIGGLIFVISAYNLKSKVKVVLSVIFLLFSISLMVPEEFNKQVSFFTSAFTDDQTVGGSSLSMRQTQTATVLYYIQEDVAFGRGYGFFNKEIGWENGPLGVLDRDLYGLEGVYLNMLLERGIVGLVLYALYWIILIGVTYIIYKKRKDRNTFALNLSILGSYLAFANMTGELDSVPITLTLMGLSSAYMLNNTKLNEMLKIKISDKGHEMPSIHINNPS